MRISKPMHLTTAAAGIAMSLSFSALAESFTFTSTSTPGDTIVLQLPDGAVVAGNVSGTSNVTWASGEKGTNSFKCTSMTDSPSATFDMTGLCDVTDGGGDIYTILFGCNYLNEEQSASNCWGGLFGKTGQYEGKSGSISWHGTATDNGGKSNGTGQWN
jgi:hypothetical protein